MGDSVYFDGDPATDSSRRHMERVLKGEPARKWPWLLAAVAGGGLWALWRAAGQAQPGSGKRVAERRPDDAQKRQERGPLDQRPGSRFP